MEISPPPPTRPPAPVPAAPRPAAIAPAKDGEEWATPHTTSFFDGVNQMIKRRLGKYCQPEHPMHLKKVHAQKIQEKLVEAVVAKERKKFDVQPKPINKARLEEKLKQYVSDHVQQMAKAKGLIKK